MKVVNNKLYEAVAKETGIDRRIVEVVAKSQFSFVKSIMESDDWKPVLLHYWGTYFPRHNKIREREERKRRERDDK